MSDDIDKTDIETAAGRGAGQPQPAAGEGSTAEAAPAPTAEEMEELKDRLLRSLADGENLRRRTARELEDARNYAMTGFARDLLEVADNLSRALASVPAEALAESEPLRSLVTGVEMTERSLLAVFERHRVKKVVPSRGDRFDHNLHHAMFEVATDELPPGTVAEVLQPGYVIADRLLRPALVGVVKAAPRPGGQSEAASPGAVGATVDRTA